MSAASRERWTVAGAVARAGEVLQQEGIRGLWFRCLGEVAYRRLLVLDRLLDEPIAVDLAGAEFEVAPRRLADGEICFAATVGGRVVGVTWVNGQGAERYPTWRPISGSQRTRVDVTDAFVDPECRGLRVVRAIAAGYLRHVRDAGYRRAVTLLLLENRSSRRACAAVGYRMCGLMGIIGGGPLCRRDFAHRRRLV